MFYRRHPNYPRYNYMQPSYSLAPKNRPSFPEVNPSQLQKSAEALKPLMHDVDKIIHEFTDSEDFAYKVMDAAQRSQTEKIKNYMQEIGIERPIELQYTPDSIQLNLVNQQDNIDCCKLRFSLQW